MASKKSSWFKKIANWVQGSLQRFADEGFSESPQKRKRSKPARRTGSSKSKPKKKPAKKTATAKKTALPKPKITPVAAKSKSVKKMTVKPVPVKARVKASLPAAAVKTKPLPGVLVGKISHYFQKANACAFRVENVELKEGSEILIQGAVTKLKIKVKSIQINRIPVPSGKPGEDIGIGVPKPVEPGDSVYLLKKP